MAKQHRTYNSFFADLGKDPLEGDYAPLMKTFRTTDNPPFGADLYSRVGNADDSYPSAYAYLVPHASDACGRVTVLFGVSKFPAILGRPTEWDNQIFAFKGDVVDGHVTTVKFPNHAFEFHAPNGQHENVPATIERVQELLAENPEDELIGPFNDGDANIRQARTRKMVPIPHRYVPLLLSRDRTPREAYLAVVPELSANDDLANCQELLDWLTLAMVKGSNHLDRPYLTGESLIAPVADAPLVLQRRALLLRQLRSLRNPPRMSPRSWYAYIFDSLWYLVRIEATIFLACRLILLVIGVVAFLILLIRNNNTHLHSNLPLYHKVVMLGDSGVGKTSLLAQLTNPGQPLNHNISATVGIEYDTQMLDTPQGKVEARIWDTAGQEPFARLLMPHYLGNAEGVVLVYDITNAKSFESLSERWMTYLNDHASAVDMAKLLVGNKADLEASREVSKEKAELLCQKYGMEMLETSAKNGQNVLKAFQKLVGVVHDRALGTSKNKPGIGQEVMHSFQKLIGIDSKRAHGTSKNMPGIVGTNVHAARQPTVKLDDL